MSKRKQVSKPQGAGLTSHETTALVGITFRQLDYWTRTGLVESAWDGQKNRTYTEQTILQLKIIAALLKGGVSLEHIRNMRTLVIHLGKPELFVLCNGKATMMQYDELLTFLYSGAKVVTIINMENL